MARPWIQLSFVLTLGVVATSVYEAQRRLDDLERAPRLDPSIGLLRQQLAEIEDRVSLSISQLETLRGSGERTKELDQRLASLEVELTEAAGTLAQQRTRIEGWEQMREQIGPHAIDERLEAFRRGAEQDWHRLDEVAREAKALAESTRKDLVDVESNLMRDHDRMWRELVGPIVQLMGDETVGSGVLLPSEPVEGAKDEWSTWLLTAWHVVRDIQAGPQNLHVPIPVTIYGQDGRIWPETAELLRYDAGIDAALLRLNTTRRLDCGARVATRASLRETKIFEQVYAVGCPLGNDPFPTFGEIADTHHIVDGTRYWMISAPTYIGNSGGGIFDARTHELLGIFSKIYTHGSVRPTVVPHMGLVTSLETIYDWLDRVGYASLEPLPTEPQQVAAAK